MISRAGWKSWKNAASGLADLACRSQIDLLGNFRNGIQLTLIDSQFRHRYVTANLMPRFCAR